MIWVSNLGRDEKIISSPNYSDLLWGPDSLIFNRYGGLYPRVKHPGIEANYSPPSLA